MNQSFFYSLTKSLIDVLRNPSFQKGALVTIGGSIITGAVVKWYYYTQSEEKAAIFEEALTKNDARIRSVENALKAEREINEYQQEIIKRFADIIGFREAGDKHE